jgi:hypothetical protein
MRFGEWDEGTLRSEVQRYDIFYCCGIISNGIKLLIIKVDYVVLRIMTRL